MRIGVIGGGQLAWMMAKEARHLGIELVVQTPSSQDPAVAVAADVVLAEVDDAAATAQLARQCDVITFENEFINIEALMSLAQRGVCFRPRVESLVPLLDKYSQRRYLQSLGLPVPRFEMIGAQGTMAETWDLPVVLKARRHGYDGQGTFIVEDRAKLAALWERLSHPAMLLEEYVPFERELAVMAARGCSGEVAVYPVVETQQENQVCQRVIAPADVSQRVSTEVEAIARSLLEQLQVVGIFGIELFLTSQDKVLINEIAPRTHNSGHYTLDACETSQFEMQLRAVAGLPLGSPTLRCPGAVMVNLLGYEHSESDYLEKRQQLAALPQAHVHWYGKREVRPGRKLGHVTVLLETAQRWQAEAIASQVAAIWYPQDR